MQLFFLNTGGNFYELTATRMAFRCKYDNACMWSFASVSSEFASCAFMCVHANTKEKKVEMDKKHHVRRSPCTPDRRFHCRPPPPTQRYPLDPRNKKLKNQIGCCATSESNTDNKADQTVQKTVHFHKFTMCHAKKNYD